MASPVRRQKSTPRVKSTTDFFLRPTEPNLRKGVLEGRSPRRTGRATNNSAAETPNSPVSHSSVNSLGSYASPRSAALSASTTAPFSPKTRVPEPVEEEPTQVQKIDFGSFDLLCLGGTIEGLAAATEAVAQNAKVCLVEPSAGIDNRAVFRLALRSCLRRQLGIGPVPATFEELRREREIYIERLGTTRTALVKQGAVVLTCSTASFQNQGGAVSPTAHKPWKPKSPSPHATEGLAKEGVAYTPRHGVRHAADRRGARGTWWSSFPPDLRAAEEPPPAEKEGLHVVLENTTRARIGTVSATHYLIAAGERSLIHGATERLEGHELCTQPEDLLEALPAAGPRRICIIGSSWTAVELCAFCELAGAEVTWFLEQVDSRLGQDHLAEMLPRLVQQVKARGRTSVHTDFNSRFVRVVQREAAEAGRASPRQGDRQLFVQAKHSGADCCGPFDVVLLFGKSDPVMHGISGLPGVQLGKDGRLRVDARGTAGPQVSAIGEVAAQRLSPAKGRSDVPSPPGIMAFGNDESGLVSQGRYFAKLLFSPAEVHSAVAPALRTVTALSHPPVGLVGLSGDEASTVFPSPQWSVSVAFSRHQLTGGITGHFVVGLTCVQQGPAHAAASREGPDAEGGEEEEAESPPFVVGAALLAESGGLPLISGLLLGFAVAVQSKVPQQQFDRILAAYPLVDHAQ
uniref:FAD/NAD(P)-binding domain-containing protein n=1 Tax=Alexandrium monilatum TaxID=311494 RepID=A0A7S4T3G2_9DINO